MSKQYWSAEKLNKQLSKIEQAGFMLPTTTYRVQSGHTRVVIANDLKNAGYVRSYEESVAFQKRAYGENYQEYTLAEYEKDLLSLQDTLGGQRSYQGEIHYQRERLFNIVEDMNAELEVHYKFDYFTTKELYDAVKKANDRVKESNAKSPNFYEYLADELDKVVASKNI